MHPHRAPRILRRMAQATRLIGYLDAIGFDEAGLIIGLERLQVLVHRGICREDRLPPKPYGCPLQLRTTTAWMGLGSKSRRLWWRPCSCVPYWSSGVRPVLPTTSGYRRSVQSGSSEIVHELGRHAFS